jgi:hypothetical protein
VASTVPEPVQPVEPVEPVDLDEPVPVDEPEPAGPVVVATDGSPGPVVHAPVPTTFPPFPTLPEPPTGSDRPADPDDLQFLIDLAVSRAQLENAYQQLGAALQRLPER